MTVLRATHLEPYTSSATDSRPAWYRHAWLQNAGLATLTFAALTVALPVFFDLVPKLNYFAVFWPFNGIIIAFLLVSPRHRWPGILAGFTAAFLWAEAVNHETLTQILTDTLCSLAEVALTALALPRCRSVLDWILQPALMARFSLIAVLGVPGLLGLPVAFYFHLHAGLPLWTPELLWSLADAVGIALWLPLTLVLLSPQTYELFRWRRLPETLLLLGGLGAVGWLIFCRQNQHLAFVAYPALLYVALRLGFNGGMIGANLLALLAASATLHGHGPLLSGTNGATLGEVVQVQLYCILAALLVFPLCVNLQQRLRVQRQLQEAYANMELLATTDTLTSLANRRRFDERLESEWKRAVRTQRPLGLLMIDVDFFKTYNDLYGHVAGDECLQHVAAVLSSGSMRQHDLRARYGGEEFVILMPEVTWNAMLKLAERLRAAVYAADRPHEGSPEGRVTISVGCALSVPTRSGTWADLVVAADRALYAAKRMGRNRVTKAQPAE